MEDTIAAISTALGVGAISIVRLSGDNAIEIANKVFKEKNLAEVESHTIHYGHIYDDNELIDEVLVSVMKSPKTYTGEDVVEINCHGGIITTNRILETLLNNGARLAEPGEFTKRAFLNGKKDLMESEAVIDIINSKSEAARKVAITTISGKTSKLIHNFRKRLKDLLSQIEVNIDYPEYYDIEVVTEEKIRKEITEMKKELQYLIKESENSYVLKNGIKTVIVGRPNVGKSSILNKLIGQDKAIVTDIEGTTRDVIEGEIYLDGILLNIIDTAGIRKSNDIVEQLGVSKSLSMINDADLVIVVLNNNEELTKYDEEILEKTKSKERIVAINKNDLTKNINLNKNIENIVYTNTNTDEGIDSLKNKIKELFNLEKIQTKDYTYLTNSRQISLAKEAYKCLLSAEKALSMDLPVDMVEIDLMNAFNGLGQIIGETYSEEILDNLFANFCVGK